METLLTIGSWIGVAIAVAGGLTLLAIFFGALMGLAMRVGDEVEKWGKKKVVR